MNNPLRCGIIGAGGFGEQHLKAICALEKEGLVTLVAVADPAGDKYAGLRKQMELRGVSWHPDHPGLLDPALGLDFVTIAAPIPLHFEMLRACIARGLFVYVEKPPVPLIRQLDQLIAEDIRERVGVGFQAVSSLAVQTLKQWIVSGRLGRVQRIRATQSSPRGDGYYERASWAGRMHWNGRPVFDGPATNAMAHLLQNIMFLADSNSQEGFAEPEKVRGELYRARRMESYDVACLRADFRSGVEVVATFAHATKESRHPCLRVEGSEGWAQIAGDGAILESNLGRHGCGQSFDEVLVASFRQFVEFAAGRCHRPAVRLKDTRGYVAASNAMLPSSEGIRSIGEEWAHRYGAGPERGWDVPGLHEAMAESLKCGRLFSELKLPWARTSRPVSIHDLPEIDCSVFFQ